MTRISRAALVATAVLFWLAAPGPAFGQGQTIDFDAATIPQLAAAMDAGTLTSERLVQLGLARIEAYDEKGPLLNAVLTLNPRALETARALDAERKAKGKRSPLHGIPIVLKDNFDTADLPTTGGSVLLDGSIPPDDAFVVQEAARGRGGDPRQGQPVGVRLGRRLQLAGRPDAQPARPGAHAVGIVGRHRRVDCRRLRRCSASAPTPAGRCAGRPRRTASSVSSPPMACSAATASSRWPSASTPAGRWPATWPTSPSRSAS